MKTRRKLGVAAVVFFVISHFLPAYGGSSGFACFAACWDMMLGGNGDVLSGGWFYYSGFAVANILFIGLATLLLVKKKGTMAGTIGSVVLFLHVLSWLVVHAVQHPPRIDEIQVGYYVWLIAYGLLVAAQVWKTTGASISPTPLEPSPLNPT